MSFGESKDVNTHTCYLYQWRVFQVSYATFRRAIRTLSNLQIYPDGIRHIRADKRVNEWKTPGKKTITKCAVNERQV